MPLKAKSTIDLYNTCLLYWIENVLAKRSWTLRIYVPVQVINVDNSDGCDERSKTGKKLLVETHVKGNVY